MTNPIQTVTASDAVRRALKRAKAHAGTAAVAALLAPLAAAPAAAAPFSNIASGIVTSGAITTFTYHVTSSTFEDVYEFELPEFNAGDFDLSSFTSSVGGWTVSQSLTATFATTGFKAGGPTPGAYVLFQTSSNGIAEGGANFSLNTLVTGFTNANFTTQLGTGSGPYSPAQTETIDPAVPGVMRTAVVPEPPVTALLLGGLTAALALARRRKA